jgi:hypothetical protein
MEGISETQLEAKNMRREYEKSRDESIKMARALKDELRKLMRGRKTPATIAMIKQLQQDRESQERDVQTYNTWIQHTSNADRLLRSGAKIQEDRAHRERIGSMVAQYRKLSGTPAIDQLEQDIDEFDADLYDEMETLDEVDRMFNERMGVGPNGKTDEELMAELEREFEEEDAQDLYHSMESLSTPSASQPSVTARVSSDERTTTPPELAYDPLFDGM